MSKGKTLPIPMGWCGSHLNGDKLDALKVVIEDLIREVGWEKAFFIAYGIDQDK